MHSHQTKLGYNAVVVLEIMDKLFQGVPGVFVSIDMVALAAVWFRSKESEEELCIGVCIFKPGLVSLAAFAGLFAGVPWWFPNYHWCLLLCFDCLDGDACYGKSIAELEFFLALSFRLGWLLELDKGDIFHSVDVFKLLSTAPIEAALGKYSANVLFTLFDGERVHIAQLIQNCFGIVNGCSNGRLLLFFLLFFFIIDKKGVRSMVDGGRCVFLVVGYLNEMIKNFLVIFLPLHVGDVSNVSMRVDNCKLLGSNDTGQLQKNSSHLVVCEVQR